VRLAVVVALPDARKRGDSKRPKSENISCTHVVNVGSDPTTVVQLEQVVAGFVIASNEDGQERSLSCAAVIFMIVGHLTIFWGHRCDIQIIFVSSGLAGGENW